MQWIAKVEQFFKKAESFMSNIEFLPRVIEAGRAGITAFNDVLFRRKKVVTPADATKEQA